MKSKLPKVLLSLLSHAFLFGYLSVIPTSGNMEKLPSENKSEFGTIRVCELLQKASRIPIRTSQCMGYFPFCLENTGKRLVWKFHWCSRPVFAVILLNAYIYFCRAWFICYVEDFEQIFDLRGSVESFGWALVDFAHIFCDGFILFYVLYCRKRIVAYMNKLTSTFDHNLSIVDTIRGHVLFEKLAKEFMKQDRKIYGSLLLGGFLCFTTYFVNFDLYITSLGTAKGIGYSIAVALFNCIVMYNLVKVCLYVHIIKLLSLGFEMLKQDGMADGNSKDPTVFKISSNSPASRIQQTEFGVVNFLAKFQKLEALVEEFNQLFGIPILLSLLLLSASLLHYIFLSCLVIAENDFAWLLLFVTPVVVNAIVLFWLCCSCTRLHVEARNAIYTLINIPLKSISKPLSKKAQMMYQKVLSAPPSIWPAGFFVVNLKLAVTMMGTLLTYCVVLVQFRITIESPRSPRAMPIVKT